MRSRTTAAGDLEAWRYAIAFRREHMVAHNYPRTIEFVDGIPDTSSGKVMRRTLRTEN